MNAKNSHKSKRHHFNPRRHLERFTDAHGCVLVYDLEGVLSPNPLPQKPASTGFEKWLYSPEGQGDSKDDVLEVWLANMIDGPGASVITKLIDDGELTESEFVAMGNYLAAQDLRTPSARDWFLHTAQTIADRKTTEFPAIRSRLAARLRAAGKVITDAELDAWEGALGAGTVRFEVQKAMWLEYVQTTVPVMGDLIARVLTWTAVHAPEGTEFLMSDAVITKGTIGFSTSLAYQPGFRTGTEWVFPLTPTTALWVRRENPATPTPVLDTAWCDNVNRRTVEQARRFVYARSPQLIALGQKS